MSKGKYAGLSSYSKKDGGNTTGITDPQKKTNVETSCETVS